ncbi:MAG: NUDIX domain-containing protein [Bacteroidia bacterium]
MDDILFTEEFKTNPDKYVLPSIAINNVIFGFDDNKVKVLLLRTVYADKWTLPGGFVLKEDELITAAERLLKLFTGLNSVFLKHFGVFGAVNRAEKERELFLSDQFQGDQLNYNFFLQRFVVLGYLALVQYRQVSPLTDDVRQCEWFDLESVPELTFDHNLIIETAIRELRFQLNYLPIGFNLLPEEFPLKSLQKIYETIRGKKLDRGNFNRKILSYGILEKKEKYFSGAANKAPFMYSFNKEQYFNALENGLGAF